MFCGVVVVLWPGTVLLYVVFPEGGGGRGVKGPGPVKISYHKNVLSIIAIKSLYSTFL